MQQEIFASKIKGMEIWLQLKNYKNAKRFLKCAFISFDEGKVLSNSIFAAVMNAIRVLFVFLNIFLTD